MEHLNLLGIQVKGMKEAILLLGCTEETLVYHKSEVDLNGITFSLNTYSYEGCKNFYFAVHASYLESKQYEESTDEYSIQLYDYKGTTDCFGNVNAEDRYIILNSQAMDVIGHNFTKEEAQRYCDKLNEAEGMEPMTKKEALEVITRIVTENN